MLVLRSADVSHFSGYEYHALRFSNFVHFVFELEFAALSARDPGVFILAFLPTLFLVSATPAIFICPFLMLLCVEDIYF